MKLTIYWKMMLGFSVIILLMVTASAYILFELNNVSDTTRRTIIYDVRAIDLAKQLEAILDDEERYAQKYLISEDTAYYSLYTAANHLFYQTLDSIAVLPAAPSVLPLVQDIERREAWRSSAVMREAALTGRYRDRLQERIDRARADTVEALRRSIGHVVAVKQEVISASIADVDNRVSTSLRFAVILTGGTLLATIIIAFILARTLTHPIRVLAAGTQEIARGAYTHITVSSHDEMSRLADAFNRMSDTLQQINANRAEMMQHISHELRMPLQTIHAVYYLITQGHAGPVSDEQRRLLRSVTDNVDKIAKFSNQFLDLSKIEAGMMEFNAEPTDLNSILAPLVEEARITAAAKKITVSYTSGVLPPVMADRDKCTQIFTNLINNAIKYTNEGGTITVSTSCCSQGVRVAVADSGIGIPEGELGKIFMKFYRSSSTVKGGPRGTGLGLALVKALVEGHGGRVIATSTVGKGSTFTVEFPPAPENGETR